MKQHIYCLMALLVFSGMSCQHKASTNKLKENYEHILPLEAALEDMDFFFKTVKQVHPNHLANISIRVGRKIKWDPVAEQIIGDEEANRLVNIPMRAPWHL